MLVVFRPVIAAVTGHQVSFVGGNSLVLLVDFGKTQRLGIPHGWLPLKLGNTTRSQVRFPIVFDFGNRRVVV
jgi:hypothetical protein